MGDSGFAVGNPGNVALTRSFFPTDENDMKDANIGTLVAGLMVGGGLLAMWVTARWPKLEPPSLRSAMLAFGVGILALGALAPVIAVAGATGGGPPAVGAALFLVVLPAFTYLSLSALWIMRMLMRMTGMR